MVINMSRINWFLSVLFLVPASAFAEPYFVFGVDGVLGKKDYPSNDSLMIQVGFGADTRIGWFTEFLGAFNAEEIVFDGSTIDRNQHVAYVMPVTGYKLKIDSDNFIKADVGYQAGFFEEYCESPYLSAEKICDRSEDYGPTLGLGYYYSGSSRSLIGIEYRRYDLSDSRQFDSVSLTVNRFFR